MISTGTNSRGMKRKHTPSQSLPLFIVGDFREFPHQAHGYQIFNDGGKMDHPSRDRQSVNGFAVRYPGQGLYQFCGKVTRTKQKLRVRSKSKRGSQSHGRDKSTKGCKSELSGQANLWRVRVGRSLFESKNLFYNKERHNELQTSPPGYS